jgi:hypothetical protein
MNSYTYSILNFVTNYILTPTVNVYDYISNLFINDESNGIEVNVEKKTIVLRFEHNERDYKIKSHIFQNNLKNVYEKLKYDLENNNFELKQFLGASINDQYDVTEIINQYAGPFGDFYQRYGMKTTIKSILPEEYHEEFSTLELMDEDGEIYYFFNITDILIIKTKNINWFNELHPEEQKKYIKHCPYI